MTISLTKLLIIIKRHTIFAEELLVQKFVEVLNDPGAAEGILEQAIAAISNLCDSELIDRVISLDILPSLVRCLSHSCPEVRRQSAWAISNVNSGTDEQADACLNAGAIHPLVSILDQDESIEVRKQACWYLFVQCCQIT